MTADALAEAYVHCGQIARENERDLWLAALFAPERLRPHLHALAAFAHETSGVAARVREPLAGEMRLAWWREALAGARPAEAAGAPIAAARDRHDGEIRAAGLRLREPAAGADVRRLRRRDGKPRSVGGLWDRHRRRADRAARARARRGARNGRAGGERRGGGRVGARARRARLRARASPADAGAARDCSNVTGSRSPQARAGSGGEGLRAAFAELADAAEARFDEAEARLAALPAALAPAFAPLATARLDLKRWRRAAPRPSRPPRRGGGNGLCGFGRGGAEARYSFAIWPRVSPPLFLAVWTLK